MISKKTKYALKAAIYLARRYEKGPILISDISRDEGIPKKFLELILLTLKNNSILQSKKGKGGGYYLGKAPADVSMGKIIRLLEGPIALVPCVSEASYEACGECLDENTCGIRLVMKDIREATIQILDKTSLADVMEREDKEKVKGLDILNYTI